MANFKHPETIGLHGGEYRSDPATTAVAVIIALAVDLAVAKDGGVGALAV